ncbi:unnamed protein product, partial [Brenthis ino]
MMNENKLTLDEKALEVDDVPEKNLNIFISDDDDEPITIARKRIIGFSDSDNDMNVDNEVIEKHNTHIKSGQVYNEFESSRKKISKGTRIKINTNSDSDSDSSDKTCSTTKYESLRTENKKKRLKDKFKKLKAPHSKNVIIEEKNDYNLNSNSDQLDDDVSCIKTKQKIENSIHSMESICDPDTSDKESNGEIVINKRKCSIKMTKSTSPKPLRMSAKQAMDNMQRIKSESNRMLREREVSLPYHRPKALSLKDIMSRRKPAVASDGKALPIKMNSDQLKQYAMMLEQRQKEVIQLCKSESEEEENSENEETFNIDTENTKNVEISILNQPCTESELITHCDKEDNQETSSSNIEENIKSDRLPQNEDINHDPEQMPCEDNTSNIDENSLPDETKDNQGNNEETGINEKSLLQYSSEDDVQMNSINDDDGIQPNVLPNDTQEKKAEEESQVMVLYYDSEAHSFLDKENKTSETCSLNDANKSKEANSEADQFMDNDVNFDEISKIIEQAETTSDEIENEKNKETINNTIQINPTPKLTGCPGTLIDLDDNDEAPRKLSGIELLKERFAYFANLKSLEDMEKDREKKYKPGTQHLKLKQELEQQIAEQRSVEWEKRLEEENKLKSEMNENISDDEIEKIEAKLESIESENKVEESSESEEEPIENDVILEDKPKQRNPMLDDEAEVSECDDELAEDKTEESDKENKLDDDEDMDDESSDSSESEEELDEESKPRKGRILKAFEDSDDEINDDKNEEINNKDLTASLEIKITENVIKDSQDDELQLAQTNRSSEELFSTQESHPTLVLATLNKNSEENASADLGTFSIMNSVNANQSNVDLISDNLILGMQSQELNIVETGLSQTLTTSQNLQSQEIGEDIAALCTGKFYDNPFVSQHQNTNSTQKSNEHATGDMSDDVVALCTGKFYDNPFVSQNDEFAKAKEKSPENSQNQTTDAKNSVDKTSSFDTLKSNEAKVVKENIILKSILDELDGPDIAPQKNKYFLNIQRKEENLKKKFIIDSDDETNDDDTHKKVKKLKKRKVEQRALQISDDEEDQFDDEQEDDESEIEEDNTNRVVEYDSEENEVEVQTKPLKKKRVGEFFENEAELTSEDEWIGSGDEDERDLDRMEREEGDDDTFQQDQLQRELGQIHMREVLDQDKREVRLLQELLFEDGDLGDGHRQRKFRWRNADGEIEPGTNPDELLDTQEEDFESEEQWRKQRHEREMFLRQMQEKDEVDLNTSINRTTIIKANLSSRSMSTLISESKCEKIENPKKTTPEQDQKKKTNKDIPSPKKPFTILQQNYHTSLLTRGRGALARLAALATPLATDDDAPKMIGSGNRGNFVFTSITPVEKPKATKRKAESNVGTPSLIKKIKTDETIKYLKSSLFDHLKT